MDSSASSLPSGLVVCRAPGALSGRVSVPGDKSISHRALMLAALAEGTTTITGLLEGEDVLRTARAVEALGARTKRRKDDAGSCSVCWVVEGFGCKGPREPDDVLDMGNSGTAARLLAGILASYPLMSVMTGDSSLRSRPMGRVSVPLSQIGARFMTREGRRLPMTVCGTGDGRPMDYCLPVASAQVKSAILLAGLNCRGRTVLEEPVPTRDHTENMLRHFGVPVDVERLGGGGRRITLSGPAQLVARDVTVPGDPSSAAFLLVAASLIPDSDLVIENMGLNPLRTGLLTTLQEMGADLNISNERVSGGEITGDIRIRYSQLKAVDVPAERSPSMIDEYPVLAVACACAQGRSRLRGLAELRVKESDRLSATVALLRNNGVQVEVQGDDMLIEGAGMKADGAHLFGGGQVQTHMDHRLAMSAAILGLVAENPVEIDDIGFIETSFPGFVSLMNQIGAGLGTVPDSAIKAYDKTHKKPLVIAIDGPAGVGKGTLARALANRLSLPYLDTGLLYRAVCRRFLNKIAHLSPKNTARAAIKGALQSRKAFGETLSEDVLAVLREQLAHHAEALRPEDTERDDLRTPEIDRIVSFVAAQEEVRAALLGWQRDFARARGGVLDGRDIGTVVFPDADIKFFVTASAETRARRRFLQRHAAQVQAEAEALSQRDKQDSLRKLAPLKAADGAVRLETDDLTASEVLEKACAHISILP